MVFLRGACRTKTCPKTRRAGKPEVFLLTTFLCPRKRLRFTAESFALLCLLFGTLTEN